VQPGGDNEALAPTNFWIFGFISFLLLQEKLKNSPPPRKNIFLRIRLCPLGLNLPL